MDWSKIKTTLILALILTNGILGTFLWNRSQPQLDSAAEQMKQVMQILSDQNIQLKAELDGLPETMPVLEAAYELYDLEAVATRFYADEYYEVNGSYIDNRSKLEVFNKNTLFYQVLDPVAPEELTEAEALQIAESFLDRIGFNTAEKVLENYSEEDEEKVITFAHMHHGQFVNGSFISLRIKGQEVVFFERQWLSVSEEKSRQVNLAPLSKALFGLVGEVNAVRDGSAEPVDITAVELGYVMDQKIFDTKIQAGEAFPYYRFTTGTGQKIYVEAIDKGR